MKITEKINMDYDGLVKNGPITIVAFGDSVTHGAVASGEINYETVYWNRLRKKILEVRDYIPVNVINAGIGGITAARSLERMESQVLAHNPDLVIVCFGLNDVNGELDSYLGALKTIFEKCRQRCIDVIFMTPNMLNTYVCEGTAEEHLNYANVTAKMQNEGRMDLYMESAVTLAQNMGVAVCDCYQEWKKLSETQDTTKLLANHINHPIKEMHEMFADKLFQTIFRDEPIVQKANDSTMIDVRENLSC